jgi:hypothetical protein
MSRPNATVAGVGSAIRKARYRENIIGLPAHPVDIRKNNTPIHPEKWHDGCYGCSLENVPQKRQAEPFAICYECAIIRAIFAHAQ